MSLLQISEPGAPATSACQKTVVGIDLGTTNSVIATREHGEARVLGSEGETMVPSVVHYGDSGPVVGQVAKDKLTEDPDRTIASAKRWMGRGAQDVVTKDELSHQRFDPSNPRMVQYIVGDRTVTPIDVSAEILRSLLARAAQDIGEVDAAVITVPAYFDDSQRQATRDAGRMAGVEILRLLAEPTAAALAYGLDSGQNGMFAVYDLGGGTFDISILKLRDGVFEVQSTGGDAQLGGDDIDRALAHWMLKQVGFTGDHSSSSAANALSAARRAKEALTDTDEITVAWGDFSATVSRETLREVAKPLLRSTSKASRRALKDAGIEAEQLDGVILVGGSTKSPVVSEHVAELFGKEPLGDIDPDHVVAIGAAIQADLLTGATDDVLLLDVIPLSLGVETMGGVVEKIIPRNSTIPCRVKQEFTTYADNQTGFDIHIVQGERETVDHCRSLGRFLLRGIPPAVAGMAKVEIVYAVDADGILTVSAKELTTGIENHVEVKPSYGLTDDEIERMLVESYEYAEDDLRERNLRIERVEASRILHATERALQEEGDSLDTQARRAIEKAMADLQKASAGNDHLAIRAAVEALDFASKGWAEQRMNRVVQQTAVGRSVSDMEGTVE